jgi:predicted exporter
MQPTANLRRAAAIAWLGVAIACCVFIYLRLAPGNAFDTNFLALLPNLDDTAALHRQAEERLEREFQSEVVWLVGSESSAAATAAAARIAAAVDASALFDPATSASGRNFASLYDFRFELLDRDTEAQLRDHPDAFARNAFAEMLTPLGSYRLASLETDPLGLFPRYVAALTPAGIHLAGAGSATVDRDGKHWIALTRSFRYTAFDLAALERLHRFVDRMRSDLPAGVQLAMTGLPLFVADGAARGRNEISTVGVGSVVIVVALLIGVFRSARPLALALLSVGAGLALALAGSLYAFGTLHLLTLVFGSTLVGVSIDYVLHYLCESLRSATWNARATIVRILPGLTLGLATTVLAYASIGVAPFPALRQIAVFSILGVGGAWLTVILLLPSFGRPAPFRSAPRLGRYARWSQSLPVLSNRTVSAALVLISSGLLVMMFVSPVDDDVRRLQSPNPTLLRDGQTVSQVLGIGRDTQFLVVRGADETSTLGREDGAVDLLDRWVRAGRLESFTAISDLYPTPAQQAANYRLLNDSLYRTGLMRSLLTRIGVREDVIERHLATFADATDWRVSLAQWLTSVGAPWRDLWLGCDSRGCASIVTMSGFAGLSRDDVAALTALPGVDLVDHAAEVTRILGKFRVTATRLLTFGVLIIVAVIAIRLNRMAALRIVAIPLGAILLTLLLCRLIGMPANLFTVFALMLVLGLGIDYAVFYQLKGRDDAQTCLAILLSALTTLTAFGLLSLSATEVVSQFGITLTIGITSAYLLGPFAASPATPP